MATELHIKCYFCDRPLIESGTDELPFEHHLQLYTGCRAQLAKHRSPGWRFLDLHLWRDPPEVLEQTERIRRHNAKPRWALNQMAGFNLIYYRSTLTVSPAALAREQRYQKLSHDTEWEFRVLHLLFMQKTYPPVEAENLLRGKRWIDIWPLQRIIQDLQGSEDVTCGPGRDPLPVVQLPPPFTTHSLVPSECESEKEFRTNNGRGG